MSEEKFDYYALKIGSDRAYEKATKELHIDPHVMDNCERMLMKYPDRYNDRYLYAVVSHDIHDVIFTNSLQLAEIQKIVGDLGPITIVE